MRCFARKWGPPMCSTDPARVDGLHPACPKDEPKRKGEAGVGYDKIMGWPHNVQNLMSAETAPCNVQDFVSKLAGGDGYYSDPGVPGGFCRSIPSGNIAAVRAQKAAGQWANSPTGAAFLPVFCLSPVT